ncbi:MAG: GMC family oxidoreductase N-terminal domain-containing protein [Sphingomonadales bacterium]|nr:GMC family oxidoreductase N-terminal domain-containing protein [Sphingomonadales bacterium]
MAEHWDYVIVGAGSAGCVLAERLSRDPAARVLVLEAGGRNRHPLITLPKGIGKVTLNPRYTWYYPVRQPRTPDMPPVETWVRGRGLGGSSAVNGMIYVRGQARDYDLWAERHGCTGWNAATMLEAFRAIEDHELGPGDGRGVGGPLRISSGTFRYPLAEAMIAAGEQLGLPRRADLNGPEQEGIGYFSHNIHRGRRQSAAEVFLKPALRRPNVAVRTGVLVDRIHFTGQRATALEAIGPAGRETIPVAGEVILSAGVMASPVILQRSGVGPGAVLQGAGVPVLADSPGVGAHLRDHLGISMPFRLRGVAGNNRAFRGLGLARNVLRYYLTRGGPLATGPYEVGAFVRARDTSDRPDLQLYGSAFTFQRGDNPNFPVQLARVEREPGLTIYGQMLQLRSEGRIAITAADPAAPLAIDPNWLSDPDDQGMAVATLRYIRRFAAQPALAPFLGAELLPGPALQDDAALLDFARRFSRCGTHAVGVCAMGGTADAVCDPDLRVRGVSGVRVVDCAAMPGLVSANTNGPAMAFAWAAADRILRR